MPKTNTNAPIAEELRANRIAAGLKPSEIDQAAYLYESVANLNRLSAAELTSAVRQHYAAVQRAADRKASHANIVPFNPATDYAARA